MKSVIVAAAAAVLLLAGCTQKESNQTQEENMTTLNLTQEWDKTFPKSDKVEHCKVTFHNTMVLN